MTTGIMYILEHCEKEKFTAPVRCVQPKLIQNVLRRKDQIGARIVCIGEVVVNAMVKTTVFLTEGR